MSLQYFGRSALRVAKNYTGGYSDTQVRVRDATSNDPWGPSGTQMNEIAQLSYNQCVSLRHMMLGGAARVRVVEPLTQERFRRNHGDAR